MRLAPRPALFFTVTCLALICAGQASAADKAPTLSGKGCQVEVTGNETASWKGVWQAPVLGSPTNVGTASDHWLTDDDSRKQLTLAVGAQKVEKYMKSDPRGILLIINCVAEGGGVILLPAAKSKYKDVPFAPKSYKLADSNLAVPGQFTLATVKVGKNYYGVKQGSLDIKKFDQTGIAGTFSLKAEKMGKVIDVSGAFDFPCTGNGSKCKQ